MRLGNIPHSQAEVFEARKHQEVKKVKLDLERSPAKSLKPISIHQQPPCYTNIPSTLS